MRYTVYIEHIVHPVCNEHIVYTLHIAYIVEIVYIVYDELYTSKGSVTYTAHFPCKFPKLSSRHNT